MSLSFRRGCLAKGGFAKKFICEELKTPREMQVTVSEPFILGNIIFAPKTEQVSLETFMCLPAE